jgi:hypothetical protein
MRKGVIALSSALLLVSGMAHAEWVTSFKQALGDRAEWENWLNSLPDGDYKDGVKFWISQRLLPNPEPCPIAGTTGTELKFRSGCWAAFHRRGPMDYNRRHDPLYLEGWNAYGSPAANAPPADPRPVTPSPAPTPRPVAPPPVPEASIKLTPAGSRLFSVTASLNGGRPRAFLLDTGATSISIPVNVFKELYVDGRITEADLVGKTIVTLANGSRYLVHTVRIAELTAGGVTVRNVLCTVDRPGSALLLGQAFLRKFQSYSIDNVRGVLTIGPPA